MWAVVDGCRKPMASGFQLVQAGCEVADTHRYAADLRSRERLATPFLVPLPLLDGGLTPLLDGPQPTVIKVIRPL